MADQEEFAFAAAAASGGATVKKTRSPAARKKAPSRKAAKGPGPEPAAARTRAPRTPRSAQEMARQQRDISVSEFFAKNRHLLGFDNPAKALLTTVKEGVDNSLDACEEAGILPDVRVEIAQLGETRFRVAIEDNGPGIVPDQIGKIFAKLLYGSKFHRLKQSRGQQGIGISAAAMYGQITTGKPVEVGTSGAISITGTLAALAGAVLVGLVAMIFANPVNILAALIAAVASLKSLMSAPS